MKLKAYPNFSIAQFRFYNNWEDIAYESEILLFKKEAKFGDEETHEIKVGKEKERIVKTRVNQSFFRSTLMASYNNRCCITGISITECLIASHIVPWNLDSSNRLNPRNGILINALHDRAFETGYITITADYKILVSNDILNSHDAINVKYFKKINYQKLILPSRFLPDKKFIEYHNNEVFRK